MPHLFAYLDPTTGSLLIQGSIAAVVAVPVLLRGRIARIVARLRGR